MGFRFSDFVLDPGTRQLRRGEEVRHLGPKAFDLLELLLKRRPNVVAKEAIRDALWPGTFVTESTLATVVGEVRAALADDAREPRFLRTVHGVGYAFCGAAGEQCGAPAGAGAIGRDRLSYRLLYKDRDITLRDYVLSGAKELIAMEEDLSAMEEEMASGATSDALYARSAAAIVTLSLAIPGSLRAADAPGKDAAPEVTGRTSAPSSFMRNTLGC